MQVTDFIKVYSNVYSDNECLSILNEMNSKGWERHHWSDPQGNTHTKEDDPYVLYNLENLSSFKLPPLINSLNEYQNELALFKPIVNEISHPRANQYREGCHMAAHNDHIHSLFNDGKGIPALSVIIMLNNKEDYDGGELVYSFINGEELSYKLTAGDVILWPSLFIFPHRVNKVTRGVRTSVVTWAY